MSARSVRTRVILGILGGALLIGLLLVAIRPRPVEVDLAAVRSGSVDAYVEEDGRARVKDRYMVAASTSGTLARLEVHAGDTVARGAVLARILPLAPMLLDARSRAEAQARVSAAAAGLAQARATVERAATALEQATQDHDRQTSLAAGGVITPAALELSTFSKRARVEELRSARFGAEVAASQLALAKVAAGQISAGATDELTATAPVAGTVLRVIQESEGAVAPGTPLLEVGDPGALEVVVDVLTQDATRVSPGARTVLTLWGGDDLVGHVRSVEPSAFTRLSALGVEEQRVNVVIDLDSPREAWRSLGDGWRVEARILVDSATGATIVPQSAVFREGDGWAVYRVEDKIARRTAVGLGVRNGLEAQVTTGLAPDDTVVVFPGDRVADGVRVVAR